MINWFVCDFLPASFLNYTVELDFIIQSNSSSSELSIIIIIIEGLTLSRKIATFRRRRQPCSSSRGELLLGPREWSAVKPTFENWRKILLKKSSIHTELQLREERISDLRGNIMGEFKLGAIWHSNQPTNHTIDESLPPRMIHCI